MPVQPPSPTGADAGERNRGSQLRVTAQRVAVLVVLIDHPHVEVLIDHPHVDVETILTRTRERLGRESTQAVYDVLRALVTVGLVRRIEPAGSPARLEARADDNHHHVVCRHCGIAQNVDCVVGRAPCLTPSQAHGFAVDEAEVTFWGVCPACADRPARDLREPIPLPGTLPG